MKNVGYVIIGVLIFLFLVADKCDRDIRNEAKEKYGNENYINTNVSSTSNADSYSSSSYEVDKTCSYCAKSFTGTHYTHLGNLADCQSSTDKNSIGKYCSLKCCSESRRR